MKEMIFSALEFAVFIPAALMLLAPVKNECRIKHKAFLPAAIVFFAILTILCSILKVICHVKLFVFFLPLFLLFLIFYLTAFTTDKVKLFYIYITVFTILSFVASTSLLVEAVFNRTASRQDVLTVGLIAEWFTMILFFVPYMLTLEKLRWLMKDRHLNSIWKIVWLVPAFIAATNCFMTPAKYSTLHIGRVATAYLFITFVLIFLFVLFQFILYSVTKLITDKVYTEERSRILKAQAIQYQTLKKYMEDTSRLRHDFLHTAGTAVTLAQNNEIDALIKLLEEYGVSVKKTHSHRIFCENDTLNAVVAFYYNHIKEHHIQCKWQIAIPKELNISDIDLCSVVGNLLNNAIQGAMTAPEGRRYITFTADVELNGDVYIVVSNSFDGVVKKEDGKYATTKSNGHGIGLDSIKTTVDKYHGCVQFHNDDENFYAEVMMQQNE